MHAYTRPKVPLHVLGPDVSLRDTPLWSHDLQKLPEYATQTTTLLLWQEDSRRTLQRLRGALGSVS